MLDYATWLFDEMTADDSDAIVDFLGEYKGFEKRVGVKTKDELRDRVAMEQSQGYTMKDRPWNMHG